MTGLEPATFLEEVALPTRIRTVEISDYESGVNSSNFATRLNSNAFGIRVTQMGRANGAAMDTVTAEVVRVTLDPCVERPWPVSWPEVTVSEDSPCR
ncbi:hypothetical protein SPFM12_00305 [Salmonella phage SPFM12]|nr:hypothetical protein SPFM12_00305 [Salmonella phage SPFM12]